MSSILTNNSAMVALQTLQSVNSNLAKTQDMISTGKAVGSAKDNAAVFAISKVMESDVSGFKAISDSLSLGESTVAVGRQAAETVTDLLTEMKGKIVAAQEENVDREKIQSDVDALREQIGSVVGAAQFNGLNLVNGSTDAQVDILSSLDRAADGSVTASNITVNAQNLSGDTGTTLTTAAFGASGDLDPGGTGKLTFDIEAFMQADGSAAPAGSAVISASDLDDPTDADTNTSALLAGDIIRVTLGDTNVAGATEGEDFLTVEVRANAGDLAEDIQTNLKRAVDDALDNAGSGLDFNAGVAATSLDPAIAGGDLEIDNTGGAEVLVNIEAVRGEGGLANLSNIDVTSDTGAETALDDIEGLIQNSVNAAAAFGSVESRISTQSDFVSKLTDSLTSGIGSLVDANMEEASARLQALQVQQQLATQSLSIANQAPQALLSLFRG